MRRRPLLVLLLLATCATAQTSIRFDLPAQPLEASLRSIGKSSDINILIDRKLVKGLQAPALNGQLSLDEAIKRLLQGTGLTYQFVNPNTVVLAVATAAPEPRTQSDAGRTDSASEPSAAATAQLQLAQMGQMQKIDEQKSERSARRPDSDEAAENEEGEVRVTGSRIRRDPAETDVSPVTVFTRQDIERSGAVVIGDFMTRITQASTLVDQRETSNFPGSGRTTIDLRGLGNNTTLVLLNGRRLPKSGTGSGDDDYNINGIPLPFIERIEVLTNSASAIYGADAIGGVVNIITRENYSGVDVGVQYGNTFDSDVGEKAAHLSFGQSGALRGDRKYSFNIGLSANDRNALSALDRPYTALSDYESSGGAPAPAADTFGLIAGAGGVYTEEAEFDPDAEPLPGLDSNFVAIPVNQDGRSLTVADFINSGPPISGNVDLPTYRELSPPTFEHTVSVNGTLNLTSNMQLFLDSSYYAFRSEYEGMPPSARIPVPAENPFNPFGIPVLVNKTFYELGPSRGKSTSADTRFTTGLRGSYLTDWSYEIYADYTRYLAESTNPVPAGIDFFNGPGALAIAETDPALALNVFGDGRTTEPNDLERLRALLGVDDYREKSENRTAAFQTDGSLMQLPGGALKLALGAEYREEEVSFYKLNTTDASFITLDQGARHDSTAAFAELSVPLIGQRQRIRGVQMLLFSLAGRLDSESLFGDEFTPKTGLMWRPSPSFALRTTYSKGYKVPNLKQLFEPNFTYDANFAFFFPPLVDPVTGEVLARRITLTDGGNPNLDPERSVSWSAGLLYEPQWAHGLSLSIDYFDITYDNKVYQIGDMQELLNLFPGRVRREPLTNRIVAVDRRAINLSTATVRGVDVRLVHRWQTAAHGAFDMHLNYTYNIENTQQSTPISEVVDNLDQSALPRIKSNGDLFWTYGAFELGPTVSYESSNRNPLFFGGTAPERIRHAIVADFQGSYNFDAQGGGAMNEWTRGLRITLGVNNVFDRLPSPTDGLGGYAKVDPRQRRYYVSLRKAFQ